MRGVCSAVTRPARFSLLLFSIFASPPVFGHGGGLDSYGCHHNRKAGGYHCHRGTFAGPSFESPNPMLAQLQKAQGKPASERKAPKEVRP